jgi:hypothetical protein
MHCKFPYFEDRPHVPLALEWRGKRARFIPLLDTGADFSVFYKSDAIWLGLDWESGKTVDLDNADGSSFQAKKFHLTLDIEGYKFKANICFVDNHRSSMPLLGRADVFKHFEIIIHEQNKFIEFKSHD